ncbi:MAG: YrdB family protein [Ktedonobacteraceae bacterium]
MFLTTIKNANLGLAFLLELGVLAALAFWGFHNGSGAFAKIALGIGLPALAIVVWALFGSPQATWHLDGIWRLLLQIVFFGSAAVALYAAGQRVWGVVFALLFVINTTLVYAWGQ